jgi:hypothetical protein
VETQPKQYGAAFGRVRKFKGNNLNFYNIKKVGTLGVHVSAQRNYMVAMKKISFTIIE